MSLINVLKKQPGETESAMMRRSQQLRSRVRHNRRQVEHHQQLASSATGKIGQGMREGSAFEAAVNMAKTSMSFRLDPQVQEWLDALAQAQIRQELKHRNPFMNEIWSGFKADKAGKRLSLIHI